MFWPCVLDEEAPLSVCDGPPGPPDGKPDGVGGITREPEEEVVVEESELEDEEDGVDDEEVVELEPVRVDLDEELESVADMANRRVGWAAGEVTRASRRGGLGRVTHQGAPGRSSALAVLHTVTSSSR